MNMLQQSKLMQQTDKVKSSKAQQQLTQLAVQQQQLVQQIQQIQIQQRQFLLACLAQPFMGVNQGKFVLNGTTVYGQQPRHVAQFDTTIHGCH
jgi:hypothetical protein